jgi:hypothetical protein
MRIFILLSSLEVDCLKLSMFVRAASKMGSHCWFLVLVCLIWGMVDYKNSDGEAVSIYFAIVFYILMEAKRAKSIYELICGYF